MTEFLRRLLPFLHASGSARSAAPCAAIVVTLSAVGSCAGGHGEANGSPDAALTDADGGMDGSGVDAAPDVAETGGDDAGTDDRHDAADDEGSGTDVPPPNPGPGPGLGRVTFRDDEVFKEVARFDASTGVVPNDPAFPVTFVKPFGLNVAYMVNGYMMIVFAPDSGGPPGGFLFYDVSDPRNIRLVNRHYAPMGDTAAFREAHAIGFAQVDGAPVAVLHTGRGVEFWDLGNVMAPRKLSELALPGVAGGDYEFVAWQLAWTGDHLYVAGSALGVYIVDTSDILAPRLADRAGLPNPVPPSELGGFRIGPLFAWGNRLIVSSMDTSGGFSTVDISEPLHPRLLAAHTRDLAQFYAICLSGNHIVTSVRGPRARMGMYDIADTFRITPRDVAVVINDQLYCAAQDSFVFQGAQSEVVKIDVSDPENATIVGRGRLEVHNPDAGQVSVFGNLVFLGNDHGSGSVLMPHQAAPDTTPPRVEVVHPDDGETMVSVRSRVGMLMSDNIELTSVTGTSFFVRPVGGEALVGRYVTQGSVVNFAPAEPLAPATTYEVVVAAGGLTDWSGNAVGETVTSTFTTADVDAEGGGAPSVALEPVPPTVVGETVTLRASAGGADHAVAWSFGDGTDWTALSEATTVGHAFAHPGHYTVVVRATNGRGWASASTRVTVTAGATAAGSRSGTLAYDAARGRVWTANLDNTTVTAVDAASHDVIVEVEVGAAPAAVAVDDAGDVWVAVRDDAALVRVGGATLAIEERIALPHASRPVAVLPLERHGVVAVALHATEAVLLVGRDGRSHRTIALPAGPGGLAATPDETSLFASRFLSDAAEGGVWRMDLTEAGAGEAPDAAVTWLSLPADRTTPDGEDRGRGVPNMLGAPTLRPGSTTMWVPATSSNVLRGVSRDGQALNHENTVRAATARLGTDGVEREGRLDFNNRALPRAIAFSPLGDWAFVVLQGSNSVQIVDAFSGAMVGTLSGTGAAPHDVLVTPDGRTAFVHGFLSRTVAAYDLGPLLDGTSLDARRVATTRTDGREPLDAAVLRGKLIFYDASDPRMSRDGYLACASCHLDGGHDGQTWDFTDRGEGLRNTIDLRGRGGIAHGPLHWTANFDEVQDFENDIRLAFGGQGFLTGAQWRAGTVADALGDPKAGLSRELDDLAAYVTSLASVPPSPHRPAAGTHSEEAIRGADVFDDAGCAACHAAPTHTDSAPGAMRHDVGTATAASGTRRGEPLDGFDTPTLLGVWATAPYLHDGSASTLDDVFAGSLHPSHDLSGLSEQDTQALLTYLREL